jgi:hypothetical protein
MHQIYKKQVDEIWNITQPLSIAQIIHEIDNCHCEKGKYIGPSRTL